jgi:hypothetical protein
MTLRSHFNIKEMVVEGLDLFNKRLKEVESEYALKDDPEVIKDNYNVCIASKKSLLPKDDYPPLSLLSSVKEMKYVHYALCVFTSAFVKHSLVTDLQDSTMSVGAAPNPGDRQSKQIDQQQAINSYKTSLQTDVQTQPKQINPQSNMTSYDQSKIGRTSQDQL